MFICLQRMIDENTKCVLSSIWLCQLHLLHALSRPICLVFTEKPALHIGFTSICGNQYWINNLSEFEENGNIICLPTTVRAATKRETKQSQLKMEFTINSEEKKRIKIRTCFRYTRLRRQNSCVDCVRVSRVCSHFWNYVLNSSADESYSSSSYFSLSVSVSCRNRNAIVVTFAQEIKFIYLWFEEHWSSGALIIKCKWNVYVHWVSPEHNTQYRNGANYLIAKWKLSIFKFAARNARCGGKKLLFFCSRSSLD